MFLPHNQTLLVDLAQNDTLVLNRDFDEFRMHPTSHKIMVDDVRYLSPTDFTFTSDGSGDITLHWLNATTLVTGKILRIGVGYTDLIIEGSSGGAGGGGDATAANQVAAKTVLDNILAGLTSTAPSAVYSTMNWTDIVFTGDTGALAAGDIIADTQQADAAVRATDALGVVISAVFWDEDDQTWATGNGVEVVIFKANRSLGTENAAPSISDANARDVVCVFQITPDNATLTDLGGVKIANLGNIMKGVKPASGTDDLYVGLRNLTGTPTYAGGAPRLSLLIGA